MTSAPTDHANNHQKHHSRSHQPNSERSEGQLTEQLNVDLLQRVDTAELVQLMVNLVEDESFVIVRGVVLHYVIDYKRRRETRGVSCVGLSACSEKLIAQSQRELQRQSEMRNPHTREACTTNK